MKLPEPKQLPSGSWFIRLRLGGSDIAVTKPTRDECVNTARLIKAEYKAGIQLKTTSKTLRQGIDDYIAARKNILSPSTIRGYRIIQRNRFQSVADRPMSSVNWVRTVNNEAALCNAKTLRNAWRFVCSVLRDENIQPPKVTLPQVIPNDRPFLEPDQIPKFLEAIKGKPYEVPALLALHSLRLSETLALNWEDIADGVIHVRGAAVPDEHSKTVQKKETKNISSRRDIPIFIPRLSECVSGDYTGKVVTVTGQVVRAQINAVCEATGLPCVGVHGLRHSFASLCYSLNVPEKAVMQIGGWANDATMKRIYTHLAQKDMDQNITMLTTFFEPKKKAKRQRKRQ